MTFRRSFACFTDNQLFSSINAGRHALAGQFSTMNGWQAGQCPRFDSYITEKRREQRFEGFDQRVERAFREVSKLHKAEVLHSIKRKLKRSGQKFTAQSMLDMRRTLEERLQWLREVWAQVDADYRSDDPARQQMAATEISSALRGVADGGWESEAPSPVGGEYMSWVYDRKQRERFAGPIEKREMEAELGDASALPPVSDDEMHHYHNLPLRMSHVEQNVKKKYGLAGLQHWACLQEEKDRIYEEKLNHAANVYKELLDQSGRYEESQRTAHLRQQVERVHQAQVRFRAAMELEKEREEIQHAHEAMEEERRRIAKEDRRTLLQEAATMKAKGIPTPEIALALKEKQFSRHVARQAAYQLAEQEKIQKKQERYKKILQQFKQDVEEREGRDLLRQGAGDLSGDREAWSSERELPWKMEKEGMVAQGGARTTLLDRKEGKETNDDVVEFPAASSLVSPTVDTSSSLHRDASPSSLSSSSPKRVLWEEVRRDKFEDPFMTIHQARLDAVKHYDAIYSKYFPTSLALGKKYSRQGMGEDAAGNEMDRQVFQKPGFVLEPYQWGMRGVHDLDNDGSVQYLTHTQWHVRDKKTGDIDWRYEKKKGGPVFRGPPLYREGARREAKDPSEQAVDPF